MGASAGDPVAGRAAGGSPAAHPTVAVPAGGRVALPGADPGGPALRIRWLGRVPYREAHALQRGLHEHGRDGWLLLLEHPHVYTLGARADLANVLVPPADVGAELVRADRGGDVTYHGPGQLVGYVIRDVPMGRGAVPAHVHAVEQLVIDALADLGLGDAGRLDGYPGVWVDPAGPAPRKIAAVGVRITRGRSMHGFALNVDPDLAMFDHIVPCGIADKAVTSLAAEGVDAAMRTVVDAVARHAATIWPPTDGAVDRQDVAWRTHRTDLAPFTRARFIESPTESPTESVTESVAESFTESVPESVAESFTESVAESIKRAGERGGGDAPGGGRGSGARRDAAGGGRPGGTGSLRLLGRLAEAGVAGGFDVGERKPDWLRAKVRIGTGYLKLEHTVRDLGLVTVCEEAGCPNRSECWDDGTATFMINGERCTRACGFCLVDTRHPGPPDPHEPERVAEAVARMELAHAVVTAVARDDLNDGGAAAFAATIEAIRRRRPGCAVEVLIPDCKGDESALDTIFAARPDVLNHNLETVARLQRAVRPSAGYARSVAVLARAKAAGLTTKSGLIVGMGETDGEIVAALADLAGVGTDIVTVGQYLRPTADHLPVARWVTPDTFDAYAAAGRALGIAHVEASPLTRSSYHARQAAAHARTVASAATPAAR